jgi:hypothetical protein
MGRYDVKNAGHLKLFIQPRHLDLFGMMEDLLARFTRQWLRILF